MNVGDTLFLCNLDDLFYVEVGVHWSEAFPDLEGLVGFAPVEIIPVLMSINSHCFHAKLTSGAENTDGDFTAISDQNL